MNNLLKIILIVIFVQLGVNASEHSSLPHTVWDRFVGALRTGKMKQAYDCLSPESRKALNFRDFCAKWHPLTSNYEAVLSPPGYSEFCISGELATLDLGLRGSYAGEGSSHQAVLFSDSGKWWVVENALQDKVITDVSLKSVLAELHNSSKELEKALGQGQAITVEDLKKELPRLFVERRMDTVLQNYEFEFDVLRDSVLRARPKREGLSGYQMGLSGEIVALAETPEKRQTAEEIALKEKEEAAKARSLSMANSSAKSAIKTVNTNTNEVNEVSQKLDALISQINVAEPKALDGDVVSKAEASTANSTSSDVVKPEVKAEEIQETDNIPDFGRPASPDAPVTPKKISPPVAKKDPPSEQAGIFLNETAIDKEEFDLPEVDDVKFRTSTTKKAMVKKESGFEVKSFKTTDFSRPAVIDFDEDSNVPGISAMAAAAGDDVVNDFVNSAPQKTQPTGMSDEELADILSEIRNGN